MGGTSRNVAWFAAACVVATSLAYAACSVAFSGTAPTVVAQVLLSLAGLAGAALLWNRDDRTTAIAILAAAVLVRAMLLPLDPVHSNDVYRYLWDGRDLIDHIDPYTTLPSTLAGLHPNDWLYAHIDWSDVPTLYPPLDLALYAFAASIDERNLFVIKSVLLLGDFATLGALALGLRSARLPLGRLAVYAWNPVVITEFAHGGHEEAWAVFWIVAALVALRGERPTTSAFSLAAAALTKLYPLAFVPVFFAARRTWHAATIAAATILLAYLPFVLWVAGDRRIGAAQDALGFLHTFAYGYRFNDSLHELIGTDGAVVVFGGAVFAAIVARRRNARLAALIFVLELVYLTCSPNVYPWYTTIFPALVPLVPFAFRGAWRPLSLGTLVWSALTPLSYLDRWVLDQDSVADRFAHVAEYVPLYLGIALALAHVARHDRVRVAAAVRETLGAFARRTRPRRSTVPSPATTPAVPAFAPRVDLRLDALPNGPSRLALPPAPPRTPSEPS